MDEPHELDLKKLLAENVRAGELYRSREDGRLECYACGHRCAIGDGKEGICRVRFNRGGTLYVPWGYVGGVALDPVEKKPFFHVLPGSDALSFGMLGCDYHCAYCQNWITSQALRDPNAIAPPQHATPEDLVRLAVSHEAKIITSTYNEPLITSEWAVEIFALARRYGLLTSYVSNGNATPEVLDYLKPWVDLYKVDLKGFNDREYRTLGGLLKTVLEAIERLHAMGFWLEVVTLVVPGFNDGKDELRDIAGFLAGISRDIPWHVTAFHADYRMPETENTAARTLVRAAEIGFEAGLHYVYAGNLPGRVGTYENTYCPSCRELLVERSGYRVKKNVIRNGRCPVCQAHIAGVWDQARTTTTAHDATGQEKT